MNELNFLINNVLNWLRFSNVDNVSQLLVTQHIISIHIHANIDNYIDLLENNKSMLYDEFYNVLIEPSNEDEDEDVFYIVLNYRPL